MENDSSNLRYFISERHPYLVVSFGGGLVKSGLSVMEKCEQEVIKSTAKLYIFCFDDLEELDIQGAKALTRLQTLIRRKPAALRLCFLNRKFVRILDQQGAIRMNELNVDIKEALSSLGGQKPCNSEEERKR